MGLDCIEWEGAWAVIQEDTGVIVAKGHSVEFAWMNAAVVLAKILDAIAKHTDIGSREFLKAGVTE